jgi:hypothetical protein
MATKLSTAEAVEYVWNHSNQIRDWYLREHNFDLDNYSRSNYRTFGLSGPGEIISSIIRDGITDGIITEDDDGDYQVM